MSAHENGRARVLTIQSSPQVARAQVASVVQSAGEAAGRSDRVHVVQHERGIGQGQAHGGFSMLFRELRNGTRWWDPARPAALFVDDRAGAQEFPAQFGPVAGRRRQETAIGARCFVWVCWTDWGAPRLR